MAKWVKIDYIYKSIFINLYNSIISLKSSPAIMDSWLLSYSVTNINLSQASKPSMLPLFFFLCSLYVRDVEEEGGEGWHVWLAHEGTVVYGGEFSILILSSSESSTLFISSSGLLTSSLAFFISFLTVVMSSNRCLLYHKVSHLDEQVCPQCSSSWSHPWCHACWRRCPPSWSSYPWRAAHSQRATKRR